MTVTSTRPAAAAGSTTSGATTTTVTRTVTLDSATTYTKTEPADASALTVGKCVTALGTTDSTGAMTAGSINIRPAVDGTCSMGFGRGQGNGANAATGATTQAG
jgi:hypothetical protein